MCRHRNYTDRIAIEAGEAVPVAMSVVIVRMHGM